MKNFTASKEGTGLLVIDVQEKLFPLVERSYEMFYKLTQIIKGFQILKLPVVVTEQYPHGLGETLLLLKNILGKEQLFFPKTTFSGLKNDAISKNILNRNQDTWVLAGIEAHVCVLQTAKDLLNAGKKVVVLNDAISSRSIFDYSTAIAEMRDLGVRITTTETILFEIIVDSKAPEFKNLSQLIKCSSEKSSCCCH